MTNKNFKAAPASPEESARIQQYWMDNFGAKWWDEADNIIKLTDRTYLYLEEGMIDWGGRQERYNDKNLPIFSLPDKKELTIDDLHIGMEVMLKPWDQIEEKYSLREQDFNQKVKIIHLQNGCFNAEKKNGEHLWYDFSSIDHIIKNDNKMKESRFPFKLSEEQFKKGLEVCCGDAYRRHLIEKHGFKILTDGYTHIHEEEYKTFRGDAGTTEQICFLDELFGKEVPDIKKGTPIWARHCSNLWWVYGKFHSFEEGKACLITIYDTKSNQFDDYSLTPPVL